MNKDIQDAVGCIVTQSLQMNMNFHAVSAAMTANAYTMTTHPNLKVGTQHLKFHSWISEVQNVRLFLNSYMIKIETL